MLFGECLMETKIVHAYDDIENIRKLFIEYSTWINSDLNFQDFDNELMNLPYKYTPPDGRLYIAYANNTTAGCIALKRYDLKRCEMKRLFVKPEFRELGIGKELVNRIIADAIDIGYEYMILDTLRTFSQALSIYTKLGFEEIEPYYDNPWDDVIYLSLNLHEYIESKKER